MSWEFGKINRNYIQVKYIYIYITFCYTIQKYGTIRTYINIYKVKNINNIQNKFVKQK